VNWLSVSCTWHFRLKMPSCVVELLITKCINATWKNGHYFYAIGILHLECQDIYGCIDEALPLLIISFVHLTLWIENAKL
jgi:hypothetical protein